jgi:2-isopropylmalate synthase
MALHTRRDYYDVDTHVVREQIYPSSQLLSRVIGVPIAPTKPIVGDNAFAHEAGIHQDGVLKNAATYEIMRPESVGRRSNSLVLGKHSGRHAFANRLRELGVDLERIDVNDAFARFKQLADKKKEIYDEDLYALAAEDRDVYETYVLQDVQVDSTLQGSARATVTVSVSGVPRVVEATGDGVVDACYRAIKEATGRDPRLERYQVKAITGGTDAIGDVSCLIRSEDVRVRGHGTHTDIVMASAFAFVDALNRLADRVAERGGERQVVGP